MLFRFLRRFFKKDGKTKYCFRCIRCGEIGKRYISPMPITDKKDFIVQCENCNKMNSITFKHKNESVHSNRIGNFDDSVIKVVN